MLFLMYHILWGHSFQNSIHQRETSDPDSSLNHDNCFCWLKSEKNSPSYIVFPGSPLTCIFVPVVMTLLRNEGILWEFVQNKRHTLMYHRENKYTQMLSKHVENKYTEMLSKRVALNMVLFSNLEFLKHFGVLLWPYDERWRIECW